MAPLALTLLLALLLSSVAHSLDINLVWETPEDATVDITQASAQIEINRTTSPIGTEWIGVGWNSGAMSIQRMNDESLSAILQIRTGQNNNDSSVRLGRLTEYATAHFIDKDEKRAHQGMYLVSKIDSDSAPTQTYTLKVIAHYNMVANNTIYQGLWSDGDMWTYMGSIILQYPVTGSIKDEVERALEEAARDDGSTTAKLLEGPTKKIPVGTDDPFGKVHTDPVSPTTIDPLAGGRPPETLATCDINKEASGKIRPVCKFVRQLPMIASFARPFSGIRRTVDGNPKFERAGVWKDLVLRNRLGKAFDISAARCVSHNREQNDVASCQRDPNSPEFFIAIDGEQPKTGVVAVDDDGGSRDFDADFKINTDAKKLPEIGIA